MEVLLATDIDGDFYNRADAVIHVANEQLAKIGRGKVSASCMYATARFNAWVTACGCNSAADMRAAKDETIDYFTKQYRAMLEEIDRIHRSKFVEYIAGQRGLNYSFKRTAATGSATIMPTVGSGRLTQALGV